MKKNCILIVFSTLLLSLMGQLLTAQNTVEDSVRLQAGYKVDAWYSLKNGLVKEAPKDNWDIAFQCYLFSAGIRINDNNGVRLYLASTDTNTWAQLDTAGKMIASNQLYNSDTSWSYGAFNATRDKNNLFDEGWGMYDPVSKFVVGKTLFFIVLKDGSVKKFWIKRLDPFAKTYTIQYGNLNESVGKTVVWNRGAFNNKMFGYFTFSNEQTLDREPEIQAWDLIFTKYVDNTLNYTVTGTLSNMIVNNQSGGVPMGVTVARVHPVSLESEQYEGKNFSKRINTIGYDWKIANRQGVQLRDSLVFFVKDYPGNIWKLVFAGYTSAETQSKFTKKLLKPVSIDKEAISNLNRCLFFPNPAQEYATLLIDAKEKESYEVSIMDYTGRVVLQDKIHAEAGLNTFSIDCTKLTQGVYMLNLTNNKANFVQKIVVN